MDSNAQKEPIPEVNLQKAIAALVPIRTPQVKNSGIDFQASFVTSAHSPAAAALVQNLNSTRKSMTVELNSHSSTTSLRLCVVDAYLPHISNLMDSLNAQPPVPIEKQFSFEWRGAFSEKEGFDQSSELIFELGMVLHTKAVLHYMYAYDLLQASIQSNVTQAAQHLCISSGIFLYLSQTLLPKWLGGGDRAKRPLELTESVCYAYGQVIHASAQSLCLVKAMGKVGGTPPGLLCKIALGVINLITSNYDSSKLSTQFLIHYSFLREIFHALWNRYMADIHVLKEETGIALGFCAKASFHLQDQGGPLYKTNLPGLISVRNKLNNLSMSSMSSPYYINTPPLIEDARQNLIQIIAAISSNAERMNNLIYFKKIPLFDELPELLAVTMVMQPTQYKEPELKNGTIIFTYDASSKPSIFRAFAGFFSGGEKNSNTGALASDGDATKVADVDTSSTTSTAPSAPTDK